MLTAPEHGRRCHNDVELLSKASGQSVLVTWENRPVDRCGTHVGFAVTDPIDRNGLRDRYWERVPLMNLTKREWEALCDGCGKCCLNKLEDPETQEIAFTRVACRLLDGDTCRCAQYDIRKQFVPDCVVLTPQNISDIAYWMPATCAYRLVYERKPLYDWHPLVSGTADTVHKAGMSVKGWTVPEFEVPEEEWEDHIVEEL